jgi:protein ImuA
LWAMEETLKCGALAAVVGEVGDMSFTASRRLQLAVEQSRVTGFVLRHAKRNVGTTACVSRWRITSVASEPAGDVPGLGFPQWKVELLRMRNGKPGVWNIRWEDGRFLPVYTSPQVRQQQQQVG